MHVISRRPFNDAAKANPNQRQALDDLYRILHKSKFKSTDEMRQVFPSLDNYKNRDKWWVIDVGGNNLRVIAFIQFINQRIYVKHIVTQADYDKLCKRYTRGEL